MKFSKGSLVKMNSDALENYGAEFESVVFEITSCANKYMPAKEFYAKRMPEGYHPGYDEGVSPMGLYDLKIANTEENFGSSLYDWELVRA